MKQIGPTTALCTFLYFNWLDNHFSKKSEDAICGCPRLPLIEASFLVIVAYSQRKRAHSRKKWQIPINSFTLHGLSKKDALSWKTERLVYRKWEICQICIFVTHFVTSWVAAGRRWQIEVERIWQNLESWVDACRGEVTQKKSFFSLFLNKLMRFYDFMGREALKIM